jgi:hypothetical protein
MPERRLLVALPFLVLALAGCAGPAEPSTGGPGPQQPAGPVFEGECVVDETFPSADGYPEGYEILPPADCYYGNDPAGIVGVYFDGEADRAEIEAAVESDPIWEVIDENSSWYHAETNATITVRVDDGTSSSGYPYGFTGPLAVVSLG